MSFKRPSLIVEGFGDEAAVPRLIRDYCASQGLYQFNPLKPIRAGEIKKLAAQGQLERFIRYGSMHPDADSVLLILDCEDFEPGPVRDDFLARINAIHGVKHTEIVLLQAEFESMFLPCLPAIAQHFPEYDWDPAKLTIQGNCEGIRNAKGRISDAMREKAYKETRDQEKFLTAIDYNVLRNRSPSFLRFEEAIKRLTT